MANASPSLDVAAALEDSLSNEADLSFKRRVPIVMRYLDPRPGERILDAGCGMGFNLRTLAELYGCRPIGVERNPQTLKRTRAELGGKGAYILRADALHLPFGDASLDKVLMTEVLEHIPDEQAALREIHRVLRPGGTYVLSVPNANYPFWWDPINRTLESVVRSHVPSHIWWLAGVWADHVRLYSPEGLASALSAGGFDVHEVVSFTHYCVPFHHLLVYGIGKNLLQRGLLPDSLARSADRFRARENSGTLLNPMNAALRFLHWIDRRNDNLTDPKLSYVGIAARALKPADPRAPGSDASRQREASRGDPG